MSNRAIVVPADPRWAVRGQRLAAQLHQELGPLALRVEHIGSTAIPAMPAKDVLDMQISVADLEQAAVAFGTPLSALGFARSPYEHDHVPAGSGDDPSRWRKRLFVRRGHGDAHPHGDVNLHIRLAGSPNEELALLFRDFLRAHPEAVAAYGEFKRVLAANVPDIATYSDVKDPVVDLIAALARQWAREPG